MTIFQPDAACNWPDLAPLPVDRWLKLALAQTTFKETLPITASPDLRRVTFEPAASSFLAKSHHQVLGKVVVDAAGLDGAVADGFMSLS